MGAVAAMMPETDSARPPAGSQILIVEDMDVLAQPIVQAFEKEGCVVSYAKSLAAARRTLEQREIELILLDLQLPDGSGMDLLSELAPPPQGPTVVVLTGDSSMSTAVEVVRRGAYDYLPKPFNLRTVLHRASNALRHRSALTGQVVRDRLRDLEEQSGELVTLQSPAMRELDERIRKIAPRGSMPVLVVGETGVGKEHLCQLIHNLSLRAKETFIAVNCANLDRNLLRSELFGHERGAFTGATERRRGLFELASHGTLLLDEVGEMPLDVQAALLRVLETGTFRRLGGTVVIRTDARVVAATNKNLEEMVANGHFRQDLLYRLNAMEVNVPPLRDRPEDIRDLAEHFCQRIAHTQGISAYLTEDAYAALMRYRWPGNIRELRNVIERTVVTGAGGAISEHDLELHLRARPTLPAETETPALADNGGDFPTLAELERRHMLRALEICHGNRSQAARLLDVSRSTLVRKLSQYRSEEGEET